MNKNPYRHLIVASKKGEPVVPGSSYKLPGQSSRVMNNKGELNANSVQDLLGQIGAIIQAFNKGELAVEPTPVSAELSKERRETLLAAIEDVSGQKMRVLGEAVASEVIDTANREGFARKFLQYRELGAGENNEVRVREHDVIAWTAVSTSNVTPTIARNRMIRPPEFNVDCQVLADMMTINTTTSDILEEKYEEALAAIMVQEDRLLKKLADQVAVIRNTLQYYTLMSPTIFARIRTQVAQWGVPVVAALMAYDLWNDIIGNPDFSGAGIFDPVTKWELIQEGYLGTLLGVDLLTDSFRQPNLRVLSAGDFYIYGAPTNVGVFSMRSSMTVEPINTFSQGKAQKGWFMNEIISMVLANSYAIAKGARA